MVRSRAFIISCLVVPSTRHFWESKFPGKLYCKTGPCTLGDTGVEVKKDYTSIEVFSDEAYKFILEVISGMMFEWTEVGVYWYDS